MPIKGEMKLSTAPSGAHIAAEEIIPMPLLPRLLGGRAAVRQIEARRRSAERIIEAHCLDRALGWKAWHALTAEARRCALAGRNVPSDMLEAIAELERALGLEEGR